ncbi:MAG TPA: M1 family metallopeptidase [Chitinophagales bacterium]|nr:M1 family metallopeptidase [Chitinophagales bacterium]
MRILYSTLAAVSLMFNACSSDQQSASQQTHSNDMVINDPHSFSKPAIARGTHLNWDAKVDFNTQTISGTATWTVEAAPDAKEIIFDTRGLTIHKVSADGKSVDYSLKDTVNGEPWMGQALHIPISASTQQVSVQYTTSADAAALQWLKAEQTRDKQHPFLFTQSQAILARTWLPCQDGPGMRFTFEAQVQVPAGMLALMSAENPQQVSADGKYQFKMEQPIPSYLMSLAVGNLAFQAVGKETGVYAEPSFVAACAEELSDMQTMLEKAEQLYGKYQWGRYDVIVLPPSFPFGGMENPRITFATPTIIAGDKSLVALVAHELAHSWSGNLVTNATWNDFWLNEGFTVYFENRIMEAVYGKDYAEMLQVLEYESLVETVQEFGATSADTHLKLKLEGRDPDEGVSDIAYNKGAYFLRLLESKVGRENWDAFVNGYFTTNAFKVMTTEAFVEYLNEHLIDAHPEAFADVDIRAWIYGPGIPDNCPKVVSTRFTAVDQEVHAFNGGAAAASLKTSGWTTHEWLRFIYQLPEDITVERMGDLDKSFHFTGIGNCEIADAWYELAVKRHYATAYADMETFLCSVGRRKFLTPLYKAMMQTNQSEMAKRIYAKARPGYHYVAQNTLDELVGN